MTGRPATGFSMAGFSHGMVMGIVHAVRRLAVYLMTLFFV